MNNQISNLPVFQYQDQAVRTLLLDGQPWFVAADVCGVLDLGNVSQALTRLDSDETTLISNEGREINVISEAGLYSLILGSRKPEAKAFKRWVTHEVLPAIRQTGGYMLPKSLPEALRLAAELAERVTEQAKQITALVPKGEFYDDLCDSRDAIDMGAMAKMLGTGRNRLFAFLREQGVLMGNNQPYQTFVDREYFRVIETKFNVRDTTRIHLKTLVLPKGQDYIRKAFRRETQAATA